MRFKDFLLEYSKTSVGIRTYLEKKGYEFVGKGVDQSAYLEPGTGKILKIFGASKEALADGKHSKDHLMFKHWADYCARHKNQFLPKFEGWEAFEYRGKKYLQIRMEKLQKLPLPLAAALHMLSIYIGKSYDPVEAAKDISTHIHDLHGKEEYISIKTNKNETKQLEELAVLLGGKQFSLFVNTIADLAEIAKDNGYRFDLHGYNFMHRNNGVPIIVDPWVV